MVAHLVCVNFDDTVGLEVGEDGGNELWGVSKLGGWQGGIEGSGGAYIWLLLGPVDTHGDGSVVLVFDNLCLGVEVWFSGRSLLEVLLRRRLYEEERKSPADPNLYPTHSTVSGPQTASERRESKLGSPILRQT